MKPILFPATSTSWTSNGLGALSDAISCVVYEERNGEYELTMTYPVGGIHFDEIHDRAIIYAIPSPYRTPQPFRVYCIDSPLNGIVTIHAHHISYDLSGIPVEPFEAGTCAMALLGLTAHSIVTNPFSVNTDKSVTAPYKLKVPTSFRACLGGQEGSILDVYGKGEYEFDKYDVNLWVNRGSDNGVKIAYGKNITDFNMEKNLESVTTGVYPYWSDLEGDELVEIPGRIIKIYDPTNPTYLLESGGAYLTEAEDKYLTVQTPFNFNNILPLDLSSEFEEKPTPDELRARAEKYIKDNSLGAPRISIDVSFIDLGQTEEYKDLAGLEACDLCDNVTVEFPMYGISVKAEIVRIETDVLLERYNSVEIGDARTSIADTIAKLAVNSASKREVTVSTQKAADYINNTVGTFEWIDNGDGTNGGFTIYEADDTSSWLRCTAGGIGISADGGLTYTNAITKDGVVANKLSVIEDGVLLLEADSLNEDEVHLNMYHPTSEQLIFSAYAKKESVGHNPETAGMIIREVHTGKKFFDTYTSYDPVNTSTNTRFALYNVGSSSSSYMDFQQWTWNNTDRGAITFYNGSGNEVLTIGNEGNSAYISMYDSAKSAVRNFVPVTITIGSAKYRVLGYRDDTLP